MINEQIQNLAERIALLLQENEGESVNDFSVLRSSLEKINERLEKIESQISTQSLNSNLEIPQPKAFHPSQQKFENLEELADRVINSMQTEKACPFEPAGKPCDHCAMCSSRGF